MALISNPLHAVVIGILIVAQSYSQGPNNLNHVESKSVSLLINQVGYDINGEKILVLQLRDNINKLDGHGFQLVNKSGKIVFSGKLIYNGRVNKDTPGDWGASYWSGNFSSYNTSGEFRIRIKLGNYNTLEPWEPHNAFFILAVSARADLVGNK